MDRVTLWAQQHAASVARWAIAIVYFWFGTLKLIGASPAEPLVEDLFNRTLGWAMPFAFFYACFAVFEMAIGVMILFHRADRLSTWAIGGHLITTIMPLLFLPQTSWNGFLTPTLIGQYILKNVLIVAALVTILGSSRDQSRLPESVKEENVR